MRARYIADLKKRLATFCADFGNRPISAITIEELDNWLRNLNCGPKSLAELQGEHWRDVFVCRAPEGHRQQSGSANCIAKAGQALAKLARGVPKRHSNAERERRRKRLAEARKKRWAKKR